MRERERERARGRKKQGRTEGNLGWRSEESKQRKKKRDMPVMKDDSLFAAFTGLTSGLTLLPDIDVDIDDSTKPLIMF